MASRKGWEQLSTDYRNRLIRKGITREAYDSGTSLKVARGKKTLPGVSERKQAVINRNLRAADKSGNPEVREAFESEIARGTDPLWLLNRLSVQREDRNEYRKYHNREPGRRHWITRRQSVAVELYYYH